MERPAMNGVDDFGQSGLGGSLFFDAGGDSTAGGVGALLLNGEGGAAAENAGLG